MSDVTSTTSGDITVEVRGLQTAVRKMNRMAEDATDLRQSLRDAAMVVARAANSTVPVLSGRLAMSIRPGSTKTRAYVAAGRKSIPYAGVIHYGWPRRNISAQPFLVNALAARQAQAVDTIAEGIRKTIRSNQLD